MNIGDLPLRWLRERRLPWWQPPSKKYRSLTVFWTVKSLSLDWGLLIFLDYDYVAMRTLIYFVNKIELIEKGSRGKSNCTTKWEKKNLLPVFTCDTMDYKNPCTIDKLIPISLWFFAYFPLYAFSKGTVPSLERSQSLIEIEFSFKTVTF